MCKLILINGIFFHIIVGNSFPHLSLPLIFRVQLFDISFESVMNPAPTVGTNFATLQMVRHVFYYRKASKWWQGSVSFYSGDCRRPCQIVRPALYAFLPG